MAESALFQSYRETEKAKARRALDEALARVQSQPAQPAGAGTVDAASAAQPSAPASGRAPGVLASVGRGLAAIPKRFVEGGQHIADALYPASPDDARGIGSRALGFGLGALEMVFPFSAFAREAGADFNEWRQKARVTDAALKAAREELWQLRETTKDPVQQAWLKQTLNELAELSAIPEAERLRQLREEGGLAAEVLAGIIPGYTSSGKPRERRR